MPRNVWEVKYILTCWAIILPEQNLFARAMILIKRQKCP